MKISNTFRYFLIGVLFTVTICFSLDELSIEERIQLEFTVLFEPDSLNPELTPPMIIRSGTPLLLDILRNKDYLTSRQKQLLPTLISRPFKPVSIVSSGGHFRIHYNPAITDTYYARRCAEFFDRAWSVEIDSLGFLAPVSDGTLGGDSLFDVYISRLGVGIYGITYPDTIEGPEPWHNLAAYIEVRDNYIGFPSNDDPEGSEWGAFKVTAAHEFHHASHFAYDPEEKIWLLETSAVWMEDIVYNYVNDYYNYLNLFFDYPWTPLTAIGSHWYSTCIYFHYLTSEYGVDLIKDIFMNTTYLDGMDAISTAMDSSGLSIEDEFAAFCGWNYLTGSRSDGCHYTEGSAYPEIFIEDTIKTLPYTFNPSSTHKPRSWGANYIVFPNPPDWIEVTLNGQTGPDWMLTIIIQGDTNELYIFDDTAYVRTDSNPIVIIVEPTGIDNPGIKFNYTLNVKEWSNIQEAWNKIVSDQLIAFPNPFNSEVVILSTKKGVLRIFNTSGKCILNADIEGTFRWNPKNLPSGLYLIKINNIQDSYLKLLYIQ